MPTPVRNSASSPVSNTYRVSAAYSPDSKTIVTASDKAIARIWDARTGQELRQFQPLYDGLDDFQAKQANISQSAAFRPEYGKAIVTIHSLLRIVSTWDTNTGQVLRYLL